jgi:tetratricopeptide (TPR) repeat protein
MDYHNPHDRQNVLKHFEQLANYITQGNLERYDTFQFLVEYWDKVSEPLWYLGYWNDYYECADFILKCAQKINQNAAIAQVLNEMGWREMEEDRFRSAKQRFTEALKIYMANPDGIVGQCRTLRYLGTLYHRQRRFGSALKSYRKALRLIDENNKAVVESRQIASEEAEIHNVLGNLYLKLNDFNNCKSELLYSLEQYKWLHQTFNQKIGDFYLYYQAAPLLNLGRLYFATGEFSVARKHYNNCILLCQLIHRPDMEAGASIRLAELEEIDGNKDEVSRLIERAKILTQVQAHNVHERAFQVQNTIRDNRKSFIYVDKLKQITQLFLGLLDILIFAPVTAWCYAKNSLKHRR